ncbi:urease accessory protein UreD [Qingshengfaniella alkalisoli]|uniref:Urease accessory protein UreD n=2 Tax=Qingshengfaniella alkalisoli TaxID=2599296 RepID=A0A5B8J037_9RHOB|nr:urease accessory protein UreD [Qingshengfaniella alkalisoli]
MHQRVRGRAVVGMAQRAGRTVLKNLHQSGSAKALLPRVHRDWPEVVFLNTAGGLTDGDRLEYAVDVAAGGRLVATTQTAERAYAGVSGTARMDVSLVADKGAMLFWLPQETILFERSGLHRSTRVDLSPTSSFLTIETVVLGRAAMGEDLAHVDFVDRRDIRRDGVPALIDILRITDEDLADRGSAAGLGFHRVLSTIAFVAPNAEDRLSQVRRVLDTPHDGVMAAASAWDGKLVVRAVANDAWPMRQMTVRIIEELGGRTLPRVWQL